MKHTTSELAPTEEQKDKFLLTFPAGFGAEEMEVIAGFNRCFAASEIFRLLETIPREEVTPVVAIHALRSAVVTEVVGAHARSG